MQLFIKRNGKFVQIFKTDPIDWCELTSATKSNKILVKIAILMVKKKIPEYFIPCPIKPMVIEKLNLTLDTKSISLFLPGVYRSSVTLKNRNNKVMFEYFSTIEFF